jgi:2-methylisocitrate lyase-like PEP mutase family enzyme
VPIVVNARTDSFWLKQGDEQLRESIARANRYREAGAHCLFVPAAADKALLRNGTYTRFHSDAVPYPEANRLFERERLRK